MVCPVTERKEEYMELDVYLWVEDITVFIRELIHFFNEFFPDNKVIYTEKYDSLDNVLDRDIFLEGTSIWIWMSIIDDNDLSYLLKEYGTKVNIDLWFDAIDFGKKTMIIAEIVNWIMRTSDTDLAIMTEGGAITFKRVQGKIYYGKESDFWPFDYLPVKYLDFDREEAFEFTRDDE